MNGKVYFWSARLCLAIILTAPIMLIAYWAGSSNDVIAGGWMMGMPVPVIGIVQRTGAGLVCVAYLGCALKTLDHLRHILRELAERPHFDRAPVMRANGIAHSLFATAAISVLSYSAVPLILTWAQGRGHRVIAFGLDHGTLLAFFAGLLALAFAHSAAFGQELADEQEYTV